jgi:ubiquinone biosynthesis protein UbiJ
MPTAELINAGLEEVINRYLSLDPVAAEKMAQLHGRVILLDPAGLGPALYLIPGPGRLQLMEHYEGEPESELKGSPLALIGLLSGQQECGPVEISGDEELAHRFIAILHEMNIDWTQQLGQYTGELVAEELVAAAQTVADYGQHVRNTLHQELRGWLHEDLQLLPGRGEVESLYQGIQTARDKVDQLEQRLQKLAQGQKRDAP